jgi:hypothetical protein
MVFFPRLAIVTASCWPPQIVIRYPDLVHQLLDNLIRGYLAGNRGPGYSVSVITAATDLSEIEVDLHFLSGRTYCCAEPGCHLPHDNSRLVAFAAKSGIILPGSVVIRWHCTVHQGARLECLKHFRMPLESAAYTFEYISCSRAAG